MRNRVNEVNSLVGCLNEMYAGEAKQVFTEITGGPTRSSLQFIQTVVKVPTPSNLCTEREAIEELLHTSTSYE